MAMGWLAVLAALVTVMVMGWLAALAALAMAMGFLTVQPQ
jgi:hypothetical protein